MFHYAGILGLAWDVIGHRAGYEFTQEKYNLATYSRIRRGRDLSLYYQESVTVGSELPGTGAAPRP